MKFKWYDLLGPIGGTIGGLTDKGQRKDWWKHSLTGLGISAAIAAPFVAPAILGAGGAAAAGAGAAGAAGAAGTAGTAAAGAGAAGAGAAGGSGMSFMKALSAMGPMLKGLGGSGNQQQQPYDPTQRNPLLIPLSSTPTTGPLNGIRQRQGSIPTSDDLLMQALMRGRRWGQY